MNQKCAVYKQLVVLSRGYSVIQLQKELKSAVCPVCKKGNKDTEGCQLLKFKNCGFVNCQWAIRGTLKKNNTSKIHTDGRTYDSKLYTFQEIDYRQVWNDLDIVIQKLNHNNNWENVASNRNADISEKQQDSVGNEMDLSLAQDNIPPDYNHQNDVIPLAIGTVTNRDKSKSQRQDIKLP